MKVHSTEKSASGERAASCSSSPIIGELAPSAKGNIAFTLVEILVVIAIVAVLAALMLPVIGRMKGRGDKAGSISNMKQIGVALNLYVSENGSYPPVMAHGGSYGTNPSWAQAITPYLGKQTAYLTSMSEPVEIYTAPGDPILKKFPNDKSGQLLSYGINSRSYAASPTREVSWFGGSAEAGFGSPGRRPSMIPKPASTILLIEGNNFYASSTPPRYWYGVCSTGPTSLSSLWGERQVDGRSLPVGNHYLFCDGSLRYLELEETYGPDGNYSNPKGMWTVDPED